MKRLALALITASLAASLLGPVPAQSAPATYSQTVSKAWAERKLDIVIVPPAHGQIYNGYGPLNGGDPNEVGPFNSYLRATEDSIKEWQRVVRTYGPKYMRKFTLKTYVVGRNTIPERVIQDTEAVIMFNEHQTLILGVTFSGVYPDCVISNSLTFTQSFSYVDMYSVNLHEFGHCLGLNHFVGPEDTKIYLHDLMTPIYEHNPGDAGVHPHCISNLNMRGVMMSFAPAFGRKQTKTEVTTTAAGYKKFPCKAKG